MSSQSLSGTAISEPNKALMPKRFYAAWAFVVVLAAVLPIAVPYAIWPPNDYERGSFDGPIQPNLYGRYAFLASFVPSSVSVDPGPRTDIQDGRCLSGIATNNQRDATAKVILRGAYGFPLGSFDESCLAENGLLFSTGIGLLLAGLAWFVGMAAVSAPFIFVLERKLAARRGSRPLLSRPISG